MKRILTSLFLLFVFAIAWLKPSIPYIQYELNKYYIQKYLCEKKEVPENSCKGKCHLRKQIKKINVQDNNQDLPLPPKVNSEDYPVFEALSQQDELIKVNTISICYRIFKFYNFHFTTSIFHPPKLTFFSS